MAGTIQFDRDAVLDRAARLFWCKGYEAASIQELEAATGLGRGSLYNAFGTKQGLFLAVLARYACTVGTPDLHRLDGPDVGAGIAAMLRDMLVRMDEPGRPRGCLITNTCLAGDGSPPVAAFVADVMQAIETTLQTAITRARDSGAIPPESDPRALARFFGAVAQSLGVLHKAHADRATLDDVVRVAMTAWPG